MKNINIYFNAFLAARGLTLKQLVTLYHNNNTCLRGMSYNNISYQLRNGSINVNQLSALLNTINYDIVFRDTVTGEIFTLSDI